MKTIVESNKKEIEELDKHIAEYRPSHKIYVKLLAIREVKCGKTHTEVAKIFKVERRTIWTMGKTV